MREKDNVIDKKAQQSQTLSVDKRKLELECAELKDNLDIKERKVNVLQRKVRQSWGQGYRNGSIVCMTLKKVVRRVSFLSWP